MEGQVGNIFENQFRTTVRTNNRVQADSCSKNINYNTQPSDEFMLSDIKIMSKETQEKHVNHMLRNSGIVAGVGVALLTPLVILAAKGKLPKTVSSYLTKRLNNAAEKMKELREKPHMTKAEMMYLDSLQKTSNTLNSARGLVLNITPLKDVMFEKVLRKVGLGKVCDKITGFFEHMAVKMTSKAYKKSGNSFTLMRESFSQANKSLRKSKNLSKPIEINGVTKTLEEWVAIAESKTQTIDDAYDAFRPKSVTSRYKWLSKRFKDLGASVFNSTYGNLKSFFSTPKKWTSFISEDMVAVDKLKFSQSVRAQKKIITNTKSDVTKELNSIVDSIESSLDLTNKESLDFLKRLKKIVKSYNHEPTDSRNKLLEELSNVINDSREIFSTEGQYTIPTSRKIKKSLGNIKYIIQTDKPGEVENLLEIYKNILPKSEYDEILKMAKKSKSALNDAVNMETENFVDKVRDLRIGSALTDVGVGMLFPLTTTAIGVSMADTKEKKRSVILKLGIPLIVGLSASMVGAIALLAGGTSMALGITTSTIANKIGSRLDQHFKDKDAQKLQQEMLQT